ncbi:formate dehydrogenase accessory sulfurtransferase FdhD [Corynebacterium lipophiloflavum]|uniref:Formate dehydrogenase accessory protein n=1 Tax=Corynebacterium lipophiloflavum (strain ATCC 700352 / DSM 44291 / CCUG 37336 / JCM 10383 / DMMZ 1944) TaxID=525263 RepID=C0XUP3_CORLD|nr:formate dehydrogenase accessory sulfurtransferase FdhD [Corynebacterium lipophiloflavum]EEI16068.1 formate dehydrogenase accessory protein [Corynebacterium lipophiloflavum DSM 44291]
MGRINRSFAVTTLSLDDASGAAQVFSDTRAGTAAAEEPLQLRSRGVTLLTTTRTPGNDVELVHGWLFTEGLINNASDVATARYCAGAVDTGGRNTYNLMDVDIAAPLAPVSPLADSCGVSREQTISEIVHSAPGPVTPVDVADETWFRFAYLVVEGSAKAPTRNAVVATAEADGVLRREDLNVAHAVDKLVGALVLDSAVPASGRVLVLDSQVTFQIARKALMAGISAIVTTADATSLAVELARHAGMTLVARASANRVRVYAGLQTP